MARIVNEKDRAVRRNEILDAAQRLVYTKGYEQMTIQDILDDLKISKGAFYHYFDSKQSLLEELTDRMVEEAKPVILPIVHNPDLPAIEKLNHLFLTMSVWKTERKAFLLGLLRAWYSDHNAIIRQKMVTTSSVWFAPMITEIVRQGIQEGVLTQPDAEQIGEAVMCLVVGLGDSISRTLLANEPNPGTFQHIQCTVAAFTGALERVLGAPSGSLQLMDDEMLKEWVVSPP